MPPDSDVTELLLASSGGRRDAFDTLFPKVYEELRRLAHARLRGEARAQTVQTTGLVHEAYLRLVRLERVEWQDRAHFMAVASEAMRRVLVDAARRRRALRRGGGAPPASLDVDPALDDAPAEAVLKLDELLRGLAGAHPRPARALELSYFAGLTNPEAADALGLSLATLERDLRFARAWLARAWGAA